MLLVVVIPDFPRNFMFEIKVARVWCGHSSWFKILHVAEMVEASSFIREIDVHLSAQFSALLLLDVTLKPC